MKYFVKGVLCAFMYAGLIAGSSSSDKLQEQNIAVVKNMFAAFNKRDWKAMAEHYADSAFFLEPAYGTDYVVQSRTEMIQKYGVLHSMFPDVHEEVVGLDPSGDKVAVEFISSGK